MHSLQVLAILGLLLAALGVSGEARAQVPSTSAPAPAAGPAARLAAIRSWGYQLQHVDPGLIASSPYDLVVVDVARGGPNRPLRKSDVERMQRKPDGAGRIILAYMSIGEAEEYRSYWRPSWVEAIRVIDVGRSEEARQTARPEGEDPRPRLLRIPKLSAPPWLGRENESWPGNYRIRYWDPGWQAILLDAREGYLARILDAGFDGVYLDRVDAFQEVAAARPEARSEMVRLVLAIAETARRRNPGFVVVPQNGEQLLSEPAYLGAIDGIAKEDLLYGETREGERNPSSAVARSMRWLAPALNRGIPVLVVEYVDEPALVELLRADIAGRGFLPYFAPRALDRLVLPEIAAPADRR